MRSSAVVRLIVYLVGAVSLATAIPNLFLVIAESRAASRSAVADAVAASLRSVDLDDRQAVDRATRDYLQRHSIAGIEIDPEQAATAAAERRSVQNRSVVITFRTGTEVGAVRRLRNAVIATIAAAIAALALLGLSVSDFLAGLQARRSEAADSASRQLFDSWQNSIQALKSRESELRRLHDRERVRAEELATITGTLVRSLSSGFIALDESGRIVDLNQAAREIVPAVAEPAGLTPTDALEPSALRSALQRAADDQAALQRIEIAEYDGRTVGLTSVPLLDPSGRYFGMLALFTDLTPVRKLEDRMREIQSLADLGELSAGIAHEFRNSLSTILGYLQLARKRDPSPRIEETLGRAEAEARELSAAVDSLLTFARPIQIETQEVDLTALILQIVDRSRLIDGEVKVTTDTKPVRVSGDPVLLARAFENLLRNAYEAIAESESQGHIHVAIADAPAPRVTIRDNGIGIDPAQTSRLFLPFQSTKSGGFGVGLALTKKIILLHGGSISLAGEVGVGAVATVELPRLTRA